MATHALLAQLQDQGTVQDTITSAWNTFTANDLGKLVQQALLLLGLVALGLSLWAVFKAAKQADPKVILKEGLWPLLVAALLVWPFWALWTVGLIANLFVIVIGGLFGLFFETGGTGVIVNDPGQVPITTPINNP